MNDGALTVGGVARIGNNVSGSAGTFTQNGGTVTFNGGENYIGVESGVTGVYHLNDGVLNSNGNLRIANNGGSLGTLNQNGGTANVAGIFVVAQDGNGNRTCPDPGLSGQGRRAAGPASGRGVTARRPPR